MSSRDDTQVLEAPDPVGDALSELQLAVLRHPVAAQAIFSALVAEGRSYAETEEGRAVAQTVAASDLAHRGRVVWDVITMSALTDGLNALPQRQLRADLDAVVEGTHALIDPVAVHRALLLDEVIVIHDARGTACLVSRKREATQC